ncbi:MAG: molecular chaperone DnaK, partial [Actinomycetota bacterium]
EAVKTAFDTLVESQQKLGEAIYAAASAESATEGEAGAEASSEDVVDAEVVDDEDEKK